MKTELLKKWEQENPNSAGEKILTYPHPRLSVPTEPVVRGENITPMTKRLVELLAKEGGAGLAANQAGYNKSLFILRDGGDFIVYINPKIVYLGDPASHLEGCLSFPGVQVRTKRYMRVTVEYDTLDLVKRESTLEGFNAIVIQHEMEHLEGKTFIDKLTPLKRDIILRKLAKWKRQQRS